MSLSNMLKRQIRTVLQFHLYFYENLFFIFYLSCFLLFAYMKSHRTKMHRGHIHAPCLRHSSTVAAGAASAATSAVAPGVKPLFFSDTH